MKLIYNNSIFTLQTIPEMRDNIKHTDEVICRRIIQEISFNGTTSIKCITTMASS